MRLAYIDESYNEDFYWFGALLVPEDNDAQLQRDVLGIPSRFAQHGISTETELHGKEIWAGKDAWVGIKSKYYLREHVFRVAFKAAVSSDSTLVFVGLDRRVSKLPTLTDARLAAILKLIDCLENESAKTGERCLLIFDEEQSTTEELITAIHQHHRNILLKGQDPRIVEMPLITPSHRAPGVQLTDLAVFLYRRKHNHVETNELASASIDRLLKIIEPITICVVKH